MPPPLQLLQGIMPVCLQAEQPTSPSDHFRQTQGSDPEPSQVGQASPRSAAASAALASSIMTSRATKPAPSATPTAVAIELAVLKESLDIAIAPAKDLTITLLRRLRGVLSSACLVAELPDLWLPLACIKEAELAPAMPSMIAGRRGNGM